jgi:hypothetical protein
MIPRMSLVSLLQIKRLIKRIQVIKQSAIWIWRKCTKMQMMALVVDDPEVNHHGSDANASCQTELARRTDS